MCSISSSYEYFQLSSPKNPSWKFILLILIYIILIVHCSKFQHTHRTNNRQNWLIRTDCRTPKRRLLDRIIFIFDSTMIRHRRQHFEKILYACYRCNSIFHRHLVFSNRCIYLFSLFFFTIKFVCDFISVYVPNAYSKWKRGSKFDLKITMKKSTLSAQFTMMNSYRWVVIDFCDNG